MLNKPKDVAELQRRLRTISAYNPEIPAIGVDGIFGPETTGAVAAFQRLYRLPVTGEVDYDTWQAIDREYLHAVGLAAKPAPISPFVNCMPELKMGDTGDIVYILQIMLRSIAQKYGDLPSPDVSGVFEQTTDAALRKIQSASGLEPSGRLNKDTWNATAALYNINNERMC